MAPSFMTKAAKDNLENAQDRTRAIAQEIAKTTAEIAALKGSQFSVAPDQVREWARKLTEAQNALAFLGIYRDQLGNELVALRQRARDAERNEARSEKAPGKMK